LKPDLINLLTYLGRRAIKLQTLTATASDGYILDLSYIFSGVPLTSATAHFAYSFLQIMLQNCWVRPRVRSLINSWHINNFYVVYVHNDPCRV